MTTRRAALGSACTLFMLMLGHAVMETARDALFLAKLGPQHLASVYLTMAGVAMLAVVTLRRWSGIRDPRRMLLVLLAGATIGTSTLALLLPLLPALVFVLYVWTGLAATLLVPTFWTLVDRTLRVQDAKKLFSWIGAGGVSGAIVGSALAGALGHVVAARYLVVAGAVAFASTTIVARIVAPQSSPEELLPRRTETLSRHSRRYVTLLVMVGIAMTTATTLADFTFKRALSEALPPEQLATVFGAIYTGLNVVALLVQLFVASRLLRQWGVTSSLMVMPILLAVAAGGFAVTGAILAIAALALVNGGLRHSLQRVASEILYLPVPSRMRDGAKPIADAISLRGGQTLAALVAFGLTSVTTRAFGIAAVVAAIVWVVGILFVRRAYVSQFRASLAAGGIERDAHVPSLDNDSVELLTQALASPDEVEALAALELLAREERVPALVLYHPRPSVVRAALSLLQGELRDDVARVLDHLLRHADARIRAAALVAASRSKKLQTELWDAVEDSEPDVRAAALVSLAKGTQPPAHVEKGIAALAKGTTQEQIALARAIALDPDVRFRSVLYQLLATADPSVMREVLHVLARQPEGVDLDRILALLADPHVRGDVRRVFTACGARGLAVLMSALDDARTPIAVRRHLPRSISRFAVPAAATALVERLPREPDGTTEFKILRALGRMRVNDPTIPIDAAVLQKYVRQSIRDAIRYTAFLDELRGTDNSTELALVRELLGEKRAWAIEHVFRGLGILHPRADVRRVHEAMIGPDEARREAAREVLESLLAKEPRAQLLAVLDADLSPSDRRVLLGDAAPGPFLGKEALWSALLADPSESLKCVVAHHVAERHLVGLRQELVKLRPLGGPPLVVYAFDQALEKLHA
jgi:ATP:ADP antiporter, AAA family